MNNEIETVGIINSFYYWKGNNKVNGEEGGLLVDSGFSGHVIRQNLKRKFGIMRSPRST